MLATWSSCATGLPSRGRSRRSLLVDLLRCRPALAHCLAVGVACTAFASQPHPAASRRAPANPPPEHPFCSRRPVAGRGLRLCRQPGHPDAEPRPAPARGSLRQRRLGHAGLLAHARSLLTGQRPLTHGVFLNDVPLNPEAVTIAKVLRAAGYDTGYIGKWHVNGDGRSAFIPPERRQGFDYWKVLECTHDYNHSAYYADGPEKLYWEGYDAIAQTQDAQQYLRDHAQLAEALLSRAGVGAAARPLLHCAGEIPRPV